LIIYQCKTSKTLSPTGSSKQKMIITEEYKTLQAVFVHRITGDITVEDAEKGVRDAIKVFEAGIARYDTINVIINTQGLNFTSLIAHRTWRQGLEDCSALRENIHYVIMVLGDSPRGRAEKEFMESDRLKFFFDLDEGIKWLREKTGP
jgi:hypothetical protein